jgi:MFS family permease
LLAFGFAMAFVSSVGQTFFIGLFGPSMQADFSLSNSEWGAIYMIGTLASALLLTWTGKLIDRMDLRLYTSLTLAALVIACATTALVAGPITLVLAIFLLRHAGQALSSHVAVTTMARYFVARRGQAIAIASLGFASGSAILPFLGVLAIGSFGWRWTYGGIAVILLVVLLPLIWWLISGAAGFRQSPEKEKIDAAQQVAPSSASWGRRQVLGDRRFLLVVPSVMGPPVIVTAVFFHQLTIADSKGWSHEWVTGSYVLYALAGVISSLIAGRLVDVLGARRIFPYTPLPLIGAMLVLASQDAALSAWPYLALCGVNSGMLVTCTSALWAELYGTTHLGAIRSMVTALAVFSSALGPILLGSLIDAGYSIEAICLSFAAYTTLGGILIVAARLSAPPRET